MSTELLTTELSTTELPAAGLPAAAEAGSAAPRLRVQNLHVGFRRDGNYREVVQGLSFDLHRGRCVAIVGESGSGKSVTARTLVGLPGTGAEVRADAVQLGGLDLRELSARQWQRVRGERIGFVLQDALVSLDPLRPVGREIDEALRLHRWGRAGRFLPAPAAQRRQRVLDLLSAVGVPAPEVRARQRPDQLSGGLRQRALIASAITLDPEILIADEPTTALDITVQAQVLTVFEQMKAAGESIVLISHDLSVVAHLADEVLVMQGGRIVEQGPTAEVLRSPAHPYTQALIRAVPSARTRGRRLSGDAEAVRPSAVRPSPGEDAEAVRPSTGRSGFDGVTGAVEAAEAADTSAVRPRLGGVTDSGSPAPAVVLEAVDLVKSFAAPDGSSIRAVDEVSFTLHRGETLGIVGESGSGKSTTARIALGLESADSGTVTLLGEPWSELPEPQRRARRPLISVVHQDPLSSFDPRWTVQQILLDALQAGGRQDGRDRDGSQRDSGRRDGGRRTDHRARVLELIAQVGLAADVAGRNPGTLSGGQRQRVAIARALASEPEVLVLDEAVSALDVSVQAQILDLLVDLQRELGTSCLFISHDLGVISHLSDRVLVMKDGRVVEHGTPEAIFTRPDHPYTRTLVASLHNLDPDRSDDQADHHHPDHQTDHDHPERGE